MSSTELGTAGVVRRLHDLPGRRFAADERVVALTFDDGPGVSSEPILELLARAEVPATFFVVGSLAESSPAAVLAASRAGHTVAGHSWEHRRMEEMTDEEVVADCHRTSEAVRRITGSPTTYVRPPYRKADGDRLARLVADDGMVAVTWSLDPRDWESGSPADVALRFLDTLHPGAIAILHDGGGDRTRTLEALPVMIEGARLAGYRFVAL